MPLTLSARFIEFLWLLFNINHFLRVYAETRKKYIIMVNPISVIKKSNLRNIVVEIYFQAGWMLMIKKVIV